MSLYTLKKRFSTELKKVLHPDTLSEPFLVSCKLWFPAKPLLKNRKKSSVEMVSQKTDIMNSQKRFRSEGFATNFSHVTCKRFCRKTFFKRFEKRFRRKPFFTHPHPLEHISPPSINAIGPFQTIRINAELRNVIGVAMWKHQSHFLIQH